MSEQVSRAAIRASVLDGVSHAFFTRQGGVSQGVYASLNGGVGSNDDPADVAENRARMAGVLGVGGGKFPRALSNSLGRCAGRFDALGRGRAAALRRSGHRDAGSGARRHRRRLRHFAFRRQAGGRDRRGACRLEGRADRHGRGAGRGDGGVWARNGRIFPPRWGRPSGLQSYEVGPEFYQRFLAEDAGFARFFAPRRRRAISCSTCRA